MKLVIVKRHLNWVPGQEVEVSDANAAKLIRDGVATAERKTAAPSESVAESQQNELNVPGPNSMEKKTRKKKVNG